MKLEFVNADGERLAGRLEFPDGPASAFAIFAHCFTCSKDIAAARRISQALSRQGLAVLRFDFTGLGNSDGDFANTDFSSNIEDLVAAAAHLRREFAAPSLLIGHSLGGAAVLAAAPKIPEVRAIATIGAPSDPAHVRNLLTSGAATIEAQGQAEVMLAGRRFTIKKRFLDALDEQHLRNDLRRLDLAVLIFHSPADEIVDIDHARQLYEALRHPKSFVSLDGADHLLSRPEDSVFVADVLAAWASRYVAKEIRPTAAALPEGNDVVTVEGDASGFAQTVTAGGHSFASDEPASVGGTETGPNPYDLLLAGLGSCTSMTLGMYARRKNWPLERVRVHLSHRRVHAADCADCETETGRVDEIGRRLELSGPLDDAQRKRLVEIADRCPVHRTLEGEIKIRTQLQEP